MIKSDFNMKRRKKCQWLLKNFTQMMTSSWQKLLYQNCRTSPLNEKTLRDFLDAIRDDIIVLVRTKGYTLADVRDTLKNAGYEVGEKALRDIIREAESKKTIPPFFL